MFVGLLWSGWAVSAGAQGADLASFLQDGDAFCTREADFDALTEHAQAVAPDVVPTCITIDRPTRVAILGGHGGMKSKILVLNGRDAYQVGWTNGTLPLAR